MLHLNTFCSGCGSNGNLALLTRLLTIGVLSYGMGLCMVSKPGKFSLCAWMGPDQRKFSGSHCHVILCTARHVGRPRNLLWVQMVQLKLLINSSFYSHNVKFYRELKSILKISCFLPPLRMLTILFTVNHNPVWHPWKTIILLYTSIQLCNKIN